MSTTQIVAVACGMFLILLLLFLVFWRRNLTAAEYTFARIVLALAVACVAVVLTGYLQVQYQNYIQAGGALSVFVIVFLMQPAALRGSEEWQRIRNTWRALHDLPVPPLPANDTDVVRALNAVNDAARALSEDRSLLRPFKADHGSDYCKLFGKLKQYRYPLPHEDRASDALLTLNADQLASHLGCAP